jgi:prepilin-type N-terminal cleavage/methylation domain-containing protein
MKNQKGFTLIELSLAAAILGIIMMASLTGIVNYDRQEKRAERSLEIKKLMLSTLSNIANLRSAYPYFEIGTDEGAYVICFDKSGVQVPFNATEQIHLTTVTSLTISSLCPTPIEIRVLTNMTANDTTWTVVGLQLDSGTGNMIQYPSQSITRTTGF